MDADDPKPASIRPLVGLVVGLLVAVVVVMVVVVGMRTAGGGGDGRASDPVTDPAPAADPQTPRLTLSGRVWLEPDLEEEEGNEDAPLRPASGCRVFAWQRSRRVGEEGACHPDGTYHVKIPADTRGPVAVEILVPGRLRAVLEPEVEGPSDLALQEVALGMGQVLGGHVVDAAGDPVERVELQAMPDPNLGEPEPWRTESGTDGSFRFDTLPPGPILLRAWKRGYTTTVAQAIAPAVDVLVVLDGLVNLRGTVVADGTLPPGTRVRLEGSSVWPAREVKLAADGSFLFSGIPDGIYAVEAVAESPNGQLWAAPPLFDVEPGARPQLRLGPAVRLPVRVLDPSRQAVARARVTVTPGGLGLLQRLTEAGPDGVAQVGPLAPGRYTVDADADGYLPATTVTVEVGEEPPERVTLTLGRPGRIEGIVVDAAGQPVADAAVYAGADGVYAPGSDAMRAQVFDVGLKASGSLGVTTTVPDIPTFASTGSLAGAAARTGPFGRFVIDGLTAGKYRLSAEKGGFARSGEIAVTLRSGEVKKGVRLRLRKGWRLTGRILDGNGRPVERARIEMDDGTLTRTDDRGVFDGGMHRGPVTAVVRATGLAPKRVTWNMSGGDRDVALTLEPAEGRVEGRVLDGNGQPIEDAMVTVRLLDGLTPTTLVWTDDRGLFNAADLPDGAAEILVQHPEYAPMERPVASAQRRVPLDVSLHPGWTVAVAVAMAGSRDPIAGGAGTVGGQTSRTDARGRVEFPNLPRRGATVGVDAAGFVAVKLDVVAERGEPVTTLFVELSTGGRVEGVVTDFRGDPVAGADLRLEALDGRELRRVRADARGAFEFGGLAEGTYTIAADPPESRTAELAPAALETDVLRGKVTRGVELRFDRG